MSLDLLLSSPHLRTREDPCSVLACLVVKNNAHYYAEIRVAAYSKYTKFKKNVDRLRGVPKGQFLTLGEIWHCP